MAIPDSLPVTDAWQNIEVPPPPPVHPVTIDPKKTAFLLLDFLQEVCTGGHRPRAQAAVPKLQAFLKGARGRGMLVVQTTTRKGLDDGSDLADAIKPIKGERVYKAPFN